MKHLALALALVLAAAPAMAAPAPSAHPTGAMLKKIPHKVFRNPGGHKTTTTMNGQGCMSGPASVAAANAVNPITGKPAAAPIVQVPLNAHPDVARATNRAQQIHACGHAH